MLSDLKCMLSVEIGLDKLLAVSTDVVLDVCSGEDNGDGLCGVGEDSVSSCCCWGPATTEWFVGFVITELECAMISRRISAQRQFSSCLASSCLSVITLKEPTQYPFAPQEKQMTSLGWSLGLL
jgi:hypothetical protein